MRCRVGLFLPRYCIVISRHFEVLNALLISFYNDGIFDIIKKVLNWIFLCLKWLEVCFSGMLSPDRYKKVSK